MYPPPTIVIFFKLVKESMWVNFDNCSLGFHIYLGRL